MTYRDGADADRPRCLPFDALSRETQEALRAIVHERDRVLLADWRRPPGEHWGWAVLAVLGGVSSLGIARYRFGDLRALDAPLLLGLGLGLGLAALLFGIPMFVLSRRENRIPRGVFLLPFDLVDTRSDHLWVFPVSKLYTVKQRTDRTELEFDGGGHYSFPISTLDLRGQIEKVQGRINEELARGDRGALLRADPFASQRSSWPADSLPVPPPSHRWWGWLVFALGVGFAGGHWLAPQLRLASDLRGLAQAERDMDDDALLRYIQRGGALAQQADELRWGLARRINGDGGLLRYLKTGLYHRDEAEKILIEQILRDPSEQRIARYLESGGRERDWADRLQLQLAEQKGEEAALRAYVQRGGKEAERVERELLPRLLIRQYAKAKNFEMLALMGSDPALLTTQQRMIRGEFPDQLREEAHTLFLKVRKEELTIFKERHSSSHPLIRALWGLAEKQLPEEKLTLLPLSVRQEDDPNAKQVQRYQLTDAKALGDAVASLLDDRIPTFLLRAQYTVVEEDPPPEKQLILLYDSYYTGDFPHVMSGRLIFHNGKEEFEVPFKSYCSPRFWRPREQILARAIRNSLEGRKEDCYDW